MKFLVDAQLPVRLAKFLQANGYDTLHTRDLPQQNATSDTAINNISIEQGLRSLSLNIKSAIATEV